MKKINVFGLMVIVLLSVSLPIDLLAHSGRRLITWSNEGVNLARNNIKCVAGYVKGLRSSGNYTIHGCNGEKLLVVYSQRDGQYPITYIQASPVNRGDLWSLAGSVFFVEIDPRDQKQSKMIDDFKAGRLYRASGKKGLQIYDSFCGNAGYIWNSEKSLPQSQIASTVNRPVNNTFNKTTETNSGSNAKAVAEVNVVVDNSPEKKIVNNAGMISKFEMVLLLIITIAAIFIGIIVIMFSVDLRKKSKGCKKCGNGKASCSCMCHSHAGTKHLDTAVESKLSQLLDYLKDLLNSTTKQDMRANSTKYIECATVDPVESAYYDSGNSDILHKAVELMKDDKKREETRKINEYKKILLNKKSFLVEQKKENPKKKVD